MAQFNNDIPLPQTKDEQIGEIRKAINYLFDKIEKLEKLMKNINKVEKQKIISNLDKLDDKKIKKEI